MARTLVIGYGNPLRSDDGIGWQVIDGLSRRDLPVSVELWAAHQLTPELAEVLSHVDRVIFVDAAEGEPPGAVTSFPVRPEADRSSITFHEVTPAGLLALCAQLYGPAPEAMMVTVNGFTFETGEALSEPVTAALAEAMEAVQALAGAVV